MGPFVGRQPEMALLRARLAEVIAGAPHVVQIEGPPGIGKTALVEQFLEAGTADDTGPVVVRASGEETEQLFAHGVVEQLARSAGPAGAPLLAALDPGSVQDPVTIGIRLLELLDLLDGRPVILVVDDAHWADRPSLQALIFALRRLVADRVLTLLVVRGEAVVELPESLRRLVTGHRGSVLRVRGLDEEDLRDLAEELGIADFGLQAAQRLRYGTQGNPLYARALLEEFPPSRWGIEQQPLPSPRSFRLLVQDRFTGCADATRRLVEAAAVLGPHCPLPLAATLAEIDRPLDAVDEAGRRDLLQADETRTPWTLSFAHPLVRAAVHTAIGPARRHALHTRAAELVEFEVEALRHRVAATAEPDEALAADLTRFADAEAERGHWQSASAHLVEASRLSPGDAAAQRRCLQAVVWTLLRGDAATAATFAREVGTFEPGALRDAVLGSLAIAEDDPGTAQALLESAWSRVDDTTDPDAVAMIATTIAIHHYGRLDAAGTVQWCERALASTSPASAIHAVAQTYLVHGLGYAGRTAAAVEAGDAARDRPDHLWLNPRSARGVLRLVEDDLDGARADLSSAATTASQLGILNTAAFGFAYLARAEWVAGEWDNALVHAERAVAINLESDFGFMQAAVVGIAVLVPAARGDWETAQTYLRAMTSGGTAGYERSLVAVGMSGARIGEARGDAPAVVAALEPVSRFAYRDAADEPGFWPWQDLYADALVATGRAAEADEFLVAHEERAADRQRRSAMARLARSRGRVEAALGRPDAAEAAFERALAITDTLPAPFERARIELAAGSVLRRAGHRRRAADLLGAAEGRFTALGARPYAERCAKELAASGLHPTRRRVRDRAELTSQEQVVAQLAAQGRSNREVADELVVSIKTIEYHLRNAFQKLGVTSRKQLRAALADATSV